MMSMKVSNGRGETANPLEMRERVRCNPRHIAFHMKGTRNVKKKKKRPFHMKISRPSKWVF